jgi:hypothetical protein
MTARPSGHERIYRGLLRLYPAAFRARFADEMVQLFSDQLHDARGSGAVGGAARTWLRALGDLAVAAASEHARRERTVAYSLETSPSNGSRLLGLAGIVGGVLLLWPAFLPALFPFELNADLFNLRLVVFNLGAIAIIVAVHRRQVAVAPIQARLAALAALVANVFYLVLIIRLAGQPGQLGPGDYGPLIFPAAVALWLTDAWFGVVTMRVGVVTRWGALALAIGSILAMTGMDRLGLTSAENPTVFGPLSLVGIALNGLGWILLGLEIATRRRPSKEHEKAADPA